MNQEETVNLYRQVEDPESVVKNLPTQKYPMTRVSLLNPTKHLKMPILSKIYTKIEDEEYFQTDSTRPHYPDTKAK